MIAIAECSCGQGCRLVVRQGDAFCCCFIFVFIFRFGLLLQQVKCFMLDLLLELATFATANCKLKQQKNNSNSPARVTIVQWQLTKGVDLYRERLSLELQPHVTQHKVPSLTWICYYYCLFVLFLSFDSALLWFAFFLTICTLYILFTVNKNGQQCYWLFPLKLALIEN